MRPTSANLALLGATTVCLLGASPVKADDNSSREVKVSVVAILASEQDNKIDPRLEDIAREIQKNRLTFGHGNRAA